MIYKVIALVSLAALALSEGIVQAWRLVPGVAHPSRLLVYATVLLVDGVLLFAMLERRAPLFGRVLWRGPADLPVAALTFDDGPSERHTPAVLDVLRQRGVKATFFVLGRHAARLPDIVARAAAEGHEVGNHGYDHRVLPLRGPGFIRSQLQRASAAIEQACGLRPRLFRAPHGWRNPWVSRETRRAGFRTVGWTLGVWDTDRPGAEMIVKRVARGMGPGCILLLHDGRGMEVDADASQVVEALPGIIDLFESRGYRLVTVSELAELAAREVQ